MSLSKFRSTFAVAAVAALVACVGAVTAARADEPTDKTKMAEPQEAMLKVGDKAPALTIANWVKGEPVTGFEKGRAYVVEFWATWCGPCRASIPHLTEMAHKYKGAGVTFVGISSSDKNLETVKKFVDKMGAEMDYTVAVDQMKGKKGVTDAAWMTAAKQSGIPCAFVVDREGKIAWIGHPMSYLEQVLEDMAANKFDSAKQQEFEAKVTEYTKAYRKAAKEEKWDDAIAAADKFGGLHSSHAGQAQEMKFWALLTGKKDYKAAYALGGTMVDGVYKDDAMNLNEMAWRIMTEEGIEQRDMALAFKAASRSNELTKGENWQVLDTLARAYFEKGDFAKAVELQTKAVEKCDQDDAKEEMTETLTKYKDKAGKN